MKKYSKKELSRHNGKNNAPAFIAYKGKIYDVSGSFHWKNGKHQVFHNAGEDLTESIAQAPHSDDILERFPVIGALDEGQ